jgi:hypothetical protein
MSFLLSALLGKPKNEMQENIGYGIDAYSLNAMIDQIATYLMTHEDVNLERQLKKLQIIAAQRQLGLSEEPESDSRTNKVGLKNILGLDVGRESQFIKNFTRRVPGPASTGFLNNLKYGAQESKPISRLLSMLK